MASALAATNPKRANAGLVSFAGFTFQIRSALLNYVRTLAPHGLHDASHLEYEALADFAIEEAGLIYTHEAKLSLTRTTLPKALSVLRDVYATAADLDPDIADRLRFRIACARLALPNPHEVARIWADSENSEAASIVVQRLVIETERDPLGELYAILSRDFRVSNPAATVDKWVRHIGEQATGRSGLSGVVVDSLAEVGPEELPFVVLDEDDREPSEIKSSANGYLVGEQPTLGHLRAGFFAPLLGIDDVEDEVWSWYEKTIDDPLIAANGSLPLYWVGGPSGSGKSVLTLQLLARLNVRSGTTVIWLGPSIERFAEAIRFAKRISTDRNVFIGLDDPFAAGEESVVHWRTAVAELAQLRHRGDIAQMPVIVCCGTSDQLDIFRQSCSSSTEMKVLVQQAPTPEGRRILGRWFADRTGREANIFDDEETILPAQLFFEWSKREGIKSFASRFRARVDSLDPEAATFVEAVLALNRIYVGMPMALTDDLSPSAMDDLRQLENDEHFGFRASGRVGYWLSHPHLANILYNTWFPLDRYPNTRASHLSRVLTTLVELDGDGRHWSRIVTALASAHSAHEPGAAGVGRLERAELMLTTTVLAEATAHKVDGMATVALAACVRLESVVQECFHAWSPTAEGVERLRRDDTGRHVIRPLVNALLAAGGDGVLDSVHEFACRDPLWDGWAEVMQALVGRGVEDAVNSIVVGIERCPSDPARIDVLESALHRFETAAPLHDLARRLLDGSLVLDPSTSLGRLARVMMSGTTDARDAAVEWVLVQTRPENGSLLVEAQRRRDAPIALLESARKWLLMYPEHPAAQELFSDQLTWARLTDPGFRGALRRNLSLRDLGDDSSLVKRIVAILTSNKSRTPWSYAYQQLLETLPSSEQMKELGRVWLTENHTDATWCGNWIAVAQSVSGVHQGLVNLAVDELPSVEHSETWPHMMSHVIRLSESADRQERVVSALEWLHRNPSSAAGWGFLFPYVLRLDGDRTYGDLDDVAMGWLLDHGAERSWRFVWSAALEHGGDERRDSLCAVALEWLASDHDEWAGVLRRLWPVQTGNERLVELAYGWLMRSGKNRYWPLVFGSSAESLTREQLIDVLEVWLVAATGSERSVIGYIWKILVDDDLRPDLPLDLGLRPSLVVWLQGSGYTRSWWHVWSWLCDRAPSDRWLIDVALTAELPKKRSHGVANRLGKKSRSDRAQAQLIEVVLRETPANLTSAFTFLEMMRFSGSEGLSDIGAKYIDDDTAEYFPAVWKFLWDSATPPNRTDLELKGMLWCVDHFIDLAWGGIWMRLWDGASGHRDELRQLGELWLADADSRRSKRRNEVDAVVNDRKVL